MIQRVQNFRCRDWSRFDRRFYDHQRRIGGRLRPEIQSSGIADAQYTANPSTSFPTQSVNHRWDYQISSILNSGNAYASFSPFISPTNIGATPWTLGGNTILPVPATATELMGTQLRTTVSAGVQSAAFYPNANAFNVEATLGNYIGGVARWRLQLLQTTNTRIWIGLIAGAQSFSTYQNNSPNTQFVGFRYSTQTPFPDTRYQCVVQNGGLSQLIVAESGGSHADTSTHIFEMQFGQFISFFIDNTLVGSLNYNSIPLTTGMQPGVAFDNVVTGNVSQWVFYYMKGNVNPNL